MTEAQRLNAIRRRIDALAALGAREWILASSGAGMQVMAKEDGGALIGIADFTGHATTDEMQIMAHAPDDVRFLLDLVERAIRHASRAASQASPAGAPAGRGTGPGVRSDARPAGGGTRERSPKDYAAEAAMKCGEPAFKAFLMERHGLEQPADDARTAQKLRGLLGVTSRAELNNGGVALERWKRLRGEFETWKRGGR